MEIYSVYYICRKMGWLLVLLHTEKIPRLVLFGVDYYYAYSANGFFRETFCLDVHYEGEKKYEVVLSLDNVCVT